MPLIRCAKCGRSYDVPGVVSVRLQGSIATCICGEWLAGSKAALLAGLGNAGGVKEVDVKPYLVKEGAEESAPAAAATPHEDTPPGTPRSIRIIAKGAHESVNTVFTIGPHPLWIGRLGCHVELAEAELSLKHCSISLRGDALVVRDADSHMGTFLDGQQIREAVIPDGTHLLRVGSAIVSIEPTDDMGVFVEPIREKAPEPVADPFGVSDGVVFDDFEATVDVPAGRSILVCIDGPLNGQEFEIPPTGLIVGREGHVRVPDEFLSRKHFEVVPDPEGNIRVRDLGSRNGTFLNTLPAQNTKVHSGDEIRAGVNRFRIEQRA
jgi:pSer/pThr/pTyr-binding forkhead associated (FHA) protein